MNTRFTPHSAVHLFLVKDGEVLLSRRKGGWKDGWYSVPAGHLEEGETATDAMLREAREEIGIDIARDDMQMVHVMHRKALDREYIDFFFVAKAWRGEPENLEPEKCGEIAWYGYDTLPEKTIQYIRHAIEHYRNRITYSETGWHGDAE